VQIRDGPAAVRGVARPPRRHWRTGRPVAGKAVGEGAPSQKTCRLLHTEPLVEGGFVARRLLVLVTVLGLVLAFAAAALGATVTVRVEGKTRSIFGSVPVKVDAPNALVALDVAGALGEFYVQVTQSSFGPYVTQIGRYPGAGSSGWVFKVNGVSPPVGADQVTLKDGDEVLWYYATFSAAGGQPTLSLKAATVNCYTVSSVDDTGKSAAAVGAQVHVDGRRYKVGANGRACVGKHVGAVRAFATGAVRSNAMR
jgi:hypothetical protein